MSDDVSEDRFVASCSDRGSVYYIVTRYQRTDINSGITASVYFGEAERLFSC